MVELATPRLLIREVSPADTDDFFRYRQDEDYWRHIPIDQPTRAAVAAKMSGWIENQVRDPRAAYNLAVTDRRSGQLLGDAGLFVRDLHSRQGEIGWGVTSSHKGQGLGTEIGGALLTLAFERLSLHRVFAQCRIENHASRRIMAKLEMREEGVLRENIFARGQWWSTVQSSILSSEWNGVTNANKRSSPHL
jgi:[ribosomal protein S5]-alanine N-acetyltransferase